ncbi:MAG: citrate lyase holo-[acyl-carrier protein] synthase [Clostridiaceae bacterium]
MENILDYREKRDHDEEELLQTYNHTLITIRPNFPGMEKRNEYTNLVSEVLTRELSQKLVVFKTLRSSTPEGLIYHLIVEENGILAKEICINLEEEHPLGRLADIDVRNKQTSFSRNNFNLGSRKCYLCEDDAIICVRSLKHNKEDIAAHFITVVKEYIELNPHTTI